VYADCIQFDKTRYKIRQLLVLLPRDAHAQVEVFGGSGAVLLNKPPNPVEIYNDIGNPRNENLTSEKPAG
jgi:site-specific DNA-adenine methylase